MSAFVACLKLLESKVWEEAPQMRYEQRQMTYSQMGDDALQRSLTWEQAAGKEAALEVFSLHADREKLYQRDM